MSVGAFLDYLSGLFTELSGLFTTVRSLLTAVRGPLTEIPHAGIFRTNPVVIFQNVTFPGVTSLARTHARVYIAERFFM